MRLLLISTGGTLDKEYDAPKGHLSFGKTHIKEMLALARCRVQSRLLTLMMKDSLDMTDTDRRAIAGACLKAKESRIVITHGTDTMEHTARLLGPLIKDKVIVLTGAMVPYSFGDSDALFNLGSAIAFAQALQPGVYVAMNGRCLDWNAATKNRRKGVFEKRTSLTPKTVPCKGMGKIS